MSALMISLSLKQYNFAWIVCWSMSVMWWENVILKLKSPGTDRASYVPQELNILITSLFVLPSPVCKINKKMQSMH